MVLLRRSPFGVHIIPVLLLAVHANDRATIPQEWGPSTHLGRPVEPRITSLWSKTTFSRRGGAVLSMRLKSS